MTQAQYTVRDLLDATGFKYSYRSYTGTVGLERVVREPVLHRLNLAVVGHFKLFPEHRIMVCGITEHSYLEGLTLEERTRRIRDILDHYGATIPLLVLTCDLKPFPEMIALCAAAGVPLVGTAFDTSLFINEINSFLEERLASTHTVQGVMVNVYGVGIILQGDSGIGKSETALELFKRGHLFVADDVVRVFITSSGVLMGTAQDVIANFIEVRGLGIVDLRAIFGIGAIMDRSRVDLFMELKHFSAVGDYDRLGTRQRMTDVLGMKIPTLTIPVSPGRSVVTLIEVAALNFRLQERGYYAAEELDRRVLERMKRSHA
jgi:HPr kinase/phosphorylase